MNNALDQVEAERIIKMGGAAVGKMEYLSLEEYTIISFLRRYCDGEMSRQTLKKELIINLGYSAGEKTFDSLKNLFENIFHHGRRALIRHNIDCDCVGADESCLAQLILRAGNNYKEEAILISLLLMPPDFSAETVRLASEIGASIKNLINQAPHFFIGNMN